MLRTLTIRSFRCFDELAVGPLGRVNLIAGRNNVGETTLLEAILLQEIPEQLNTSVVVNQTRGIEAKMEDPWTWLLLFPQDQWRVAGGDIGAQRHWRFAASDRVQERYVVSIL